MRRAYRTVGRVCGIGGKTQLGALLNLFANNATVTANDDRNVTADGTTQSIEAWFDYMNEEFDKLYEIYT